MMYKLACAYSKDSNQSVQTLDPWLSIERPSDCADVQADLSLRWEHMLTCIFC